MSKVDYRNKALPKIPVIFLFFFPLSIFMVLYLMFDKWSYF